MRGPIDYIVVGFTGNKFDGSILNELAIAIDQGIISLVALSAISKDDQGNFTLIDISDNGDEQSFNFFQKYKPSENSLDEDDFSEIADLIEPNTAAGILIIEHLWAKGLKKAIIDANGILIAEGRIHPEAAKELESEEL
mgnify:CR=1 FL=1